MDVAHKNLPVDKKIKSRSIWCISLIVLFLLSYCREVGFRSINALIAGEATFYAKTKELPFLLNYTNKELGLLKYFLTIIFTVLFMVTTAIGVGWGIKKHLGILLMKIIYSTCVTLAVSLILIGIILNQYQTIYPYLRILIGWIHTPLIFLFISIIVHSSNNIEKDN